MVAADRHVYKPATLTAYRAAKGCTLLRSGHTLTSSSTTRNGIEKLICHQGAVKAIAAGLHLKNSSSVCCAVLRYTLLKSGIVTRRANRTSKMLLPLACKNNFDWHSKVDTAKSFCLGNCDCASK